MIVKISQGKSFKGLAAYLTHDPQARSDERVAWTHTENLANDHVPSAVDEMHWTARNAELLKHEAGIRGGGRSTTNAVKHVSLNWAPGETPTREHMIATSNGFLLHMGWHEHQVVMVAHDDKAYRHVHLMINTIHPETGLRLDDNFERRRAQAWALNYEREQDHIHCEQRLKNAEDREPSMPRNVWMEFEKNRHEFQRSEKLILENAEKDRGIPDNSQDSEWKILKEIQRAQRLEFAWSADDEFSELRDQIYQKSREEFRGRWAEYFDLRRDGGEPDFLRTVKDEIIADQKVERARAWDLGRNELKSERFGRYEELLARQQDEREDLRWHQEVGLDTSDFFQKLTADRTPAPALELGWTEARHEVTSRARVEELNQSESAPYETAADAAADAALGPIGRGALAFADALFFDLTNLGAARPEPPTREERREAYRIASEEANKQRQLEQVDLEDTERQQRQRVLYRE